MNKHLCLALFCFCFAAGGAPARADAQTEDAGCRDVRGLPVGLVMDGAISDLALATVIEGQPIILYSPELERAVAPATGLFVYAHECGHQALGHVLDSATPNREQEADCWAINLIYRNALVDDAGLRVIVRDIARFGVGDATHLPGPMRALSLDDCLQPGNRFAHTAAPPDRAGKVAQGGQDFARHGSGLNNAFARELMGISGAR
jgi:hypothetical protein